MPSVARKTPSPAASPKDVKESEVIQTQIKGLYLNSIRPFLSEPRNSKQHAVCRNAGGKVLEGMKTLVQSNKSRDSISAIIELFEERKRFDLQCQLRSWMQGWLIIHIPATVALAVFFVVHVITALRVVPPF